MAIHIFESIDWLIGVLWHFNTRRVHSARGRNGRVIKDSQWGTIVKIGKDWTWSQSTNILRCWGSQTPHDKMNYRIHYSLASKLRPTVNLPDEFDGSYARATNNQQHGRAMFTVRRFYHSLPMRENWLEVRVGGVWQIVTFAEIIFCKQ